MKRQILERAVSLFLSLQFQDREQISEHIEANTKWPNLERSFCLSSLCWNKRTLQCALFSFSFFGPACACLFRFGSEAVQSNTSMVLLEHDHFVSLLACLPRLVRCSHIVCRVPWHSHPRIRVVRLEPAHIVVNML